MQTSTTASFYLALALGSIASCQSSQADPSGTSETTDTGDAGLTYYRDVQPVIAEHCGACHTEGGSAPFGLTTYDQVVTVASLARAAIESGTMPPWQADPDCRTYKYERRMSEDQISTVLAWIDQGMAEGDPADAQPFEPPDLSLPLEDVSVVARSASPYTPDPGAVDDYHCLVLDSEFTEPTYLSAYEVVPDAAGMVHHIIFFLVPPTSVPALTAADAATPEPGYPCFGSSGYGGQPMGVWAPGGVPMRFPQDAAYVIPAGAKIVAQMHYYTGGQTPTPDDTELRLAYLSEPPALRVTMPILSGFFDIPANDPAFVTEFELAIDDPQPKQIFSVMPHMHLIGEQIELQRERDGEQTCIARVNDWDFNWQQFYDLHDDDLIEVRAGDTLRYTCVFDNSPENQPIVDGEQQPSGPIEFGEGTNDEMCLNVVAMLEPYVESDPTALCEGLTECYTQTCDPADGVCFLGCGLSSDECGGCLLQGTASCGQTVCPAEAAAVISCLGSSCSADFNDLAAVQGCLANECAVEFEAQWSCMLPHIQAGECSDAYGPCGYTP